MKSTLPPPLLLDAKQTAALLNVSLRTPWGIPETDLPVVRIGRRVLYAKSDIEAFIEKRKEGRQ